MGGASCSDLSPERSTVAEIVASVTQRLATRLGQEAAHEARDLVAAMMSQPRSWPSYAQASTLARESVAAITLATERRALGAPLAYAVRSAQFRQLLLYVDERVLIPRPETEYLIDRVLATEQGRAGGMAVDVGTGSGAIALALACETQFSRVIATDVSADALAVARENARRHAEALAATVEFRAGDALTPLDDLRGLVDIVVSNPPYIAFGELSSLPESVRDWEPTLALVCPDDGLAVTRAIVAGGGRLLRAGGLLAFETDVQRSRRVAQMVVDDGSFDDVRALQDLAGRERYVLATRR